jgi:hypothetical protein
MSEFEIDDSVQIEDGQEVLKIVGIGPGPFYTLQSGNDAGTGQLVLGSKLKLVAKA